MARQKYSQYEQSDVNRLIVLASRASEMIWVVSECERCQLGRPDCVKVGGQIIKLLKKMRGIAGASAEKESELLYGRIQRYSKMWPSIGTDYEFIHDHVYGKQWRVNERGAIRYEEAVRWVATLGHGWRMPTRDEVAGLYEEDVGECNIDQVFELKPDSSYVWSVGSKSSGGWLYGFRIHAGFGERCIRKSERQNVVGVAFAVNDHHGHY